MSYTPRFLGLLGAVTIILHTGCIESDSQFCSWGTVCPPGTVCSERYQGCVGQEVMTCSFGPCSHPAQICNDEHRQCIFPIQISLCDEKEDGAFCVPPDSEGLHRCLRGVCIRPYCGDGFIDDSSNIATDAIEATEACDDGNFASNDGCSAACRQEAGWDCDRAEPTQCNPGPLRYRPGDSLALPTVGGLVHSVGDVLHTPDGTLYVSFHGTGGDMDCFLARSTDFGDSWQIENLGRVEGDTASPRLWLLDDGTIGLTAYETGSPKDAHLRLSDDGGQSFGDWIRLSGNEPNAVSYLGASCVAFTPEGAWIAAYPRDSGVYAKRSEAASASSWALAGEFTIYDVERRGSAVLTIDGTRVLLATDNTSNIMEIYGSEDDARSFGLISAIQSSMVMAPKRFHRSATTGAVYLCATGNSASYDNGTVQVFRSLDGGVHWNEGTVYLSGLRQQASTTIGCFIDDTGVYVSYQEADSGEMRLIVPGDPNSCGNHLREPGEMCDGQDFGVNTCLHLGYGGGSLACSNDCQALDDAGCLPADYPTSCAFIDVPVDRQHLIDPDGFGSMPAFEVFCADMDTSNPKTYLSLTVSDATHNSARYLYTTPDTEVRCEYTKILFADLPNLILDGRDGRFATCYGNGEYADYTRWDAANSCTLGDPGTMNIDLTGTPFAVDLEGGVTWNVNGYLPEGQWHANAEGTVIDATGFGYCGGTTPATPPGLRLRFR